MTPAKVQVMLVIILVSSINNKYSLAYAMNFSPFMNKHFLKIIFIS